jgi:hypothetical protein
LKKLAGKADTRAIALALLKAFNGRLLFTGVLRVLYGRIGWWICALVFAVFKLRLQTLGRFSVPPIVDSCCLWRIEVHNARLPCSAAI